MDISASGATASGAIKDNTGAQVILKTLEKANSVPGSMDGASQALQKTARNDAGIGNKLDTVV